MIAKVLVKLAVLHALVLVLAAALAVRVVAKVLVQEAVKIAVSKSVNQVAMTLVWAAKVLMQARVALIVNAELSRVIYMYQDGYVVRREFLQKVKDAIFDIDIEGELNDFIFNRKCYGPSDYSLLPLLFLKLVALRKINHVHLERNIRFIVDKADIYFNLV